MTVKKTLKELNKQQLTTLFKLALSDLEIDIPNDEKKELEEVIDYKTVIYGTVGQEVHPSTTLAIIYKAIAKSDEKEFEKRYVNSLADILEETVNNLDELDLKDWGVEYIKELLISITGMRGSFKKEKAGEIISNIKRLYKNKKLMGLNEELEAYTVKCLWSFMDVIKNNDLKFWLNVIEKRNNTPVAFMAILKIDPAKAEEYLPLLVKWYYNRKEGAKFALSLTLEKYLTRGKKELSKEKLELSKDKIKTLKKLLSKLKGSKEEFLIKQLKHILAESTLERVLA